MFASHAKISESVAWPVKEPDDGKNSERRAKQWRIRNRTSVSQVRSTRATHAVAQLRDGGLVRLQDYKHGKNLICIH